MHRGCFVWTLTPPLAGWRTPRLGPARVCVCLLFLAGSGGLASRACSGAPQLFLLAALAFCFPWPLRSLFFFFLVRAPVVLSFLWFPAPGALGLGAVLWAFFSSRLSALRARSLSFFFLAVGCSLVLGAPPPFLFVRLVSLLPLGFPSPLFFCVRPCCLWLPLVSGPGCPGPWRCVLFALLASHFSALRALSPFSVSRLTVGCSLVVAAPPPLPLGAPFFFFFALCAPVLSGSSGFRPRVPWVVCFVGLPLLGAPCVLASFVPPVWPLAAPRWLPPRPPLLCLAVLVASARCCVPCVVLCCVSRVAMVRCAAARCVARCCAVLCCVVLLRSVGAAARRAVPSGAPRCPGALCFAALCFAVFPRAVCVLSLRGGVCCRSLLCFVLCVSLGAVLCVPCPLRSVRCCASLCWCACVVLFVWCVLLLAPGAVVRCCVLCCFLWCAVVRCWVWWPVVVCWCRAVAPRCPFSFAGGVCLCLYPVGAVLCCTAHRVVRFRLRLRCCWYLVLWRVLVCCGVFLGVLLCAGASLVCRCVLLCCALSCGVLRPVLCPAVLYCLAVLCWWAVLCRCLRCWCLFFLLSSFPLLITPAVFPCL